MRTLPWPDRLGIRIATLCLFATAASVALFSHSWCIAGPSRGSFPTALARAVSLPAQLFPILVGMIWVVARLVGLRLGGPRKRRLR